MNIWTDGGSFPIHPDEPGGWAFVAEERGKLVYQRSGAEIRSTPYRMELRAVVEGLRWAFERHPDERLVVITDSRDILKGAPLHGVARKADPLWADFDFLREARGSAPISFAWTKGHNGERFNEAADKAATKARQRLVRQLQDGRREGAFI